jgi:hypothetical protein
LERCAHGGDIDAEVDFTFQFELCALSANLALQSLSDSLISIHRGFGQRRAVNVLPKELSRRRHCLPQ